MLFHVCFALTQHIQYAFVFCFWVFFSERKKSVRIYLIKNMKKDVLIMQEVPRADGAEKMHCEICYSLSYTVILINSNMDICA